MNATELSEIAKITELKSDDFTYLKMGPRTAAILTRRHFGVGMRVEDRTVYCTPLESMGNVDMGLADEIVIALIAEKAELKLPATFEVLLLEWRKHRIAKPDETWRPASHALFKIETEAKRYLASQPTDA